MSKTSKSAAAPKTVGTNRNVTSSFEPKPDVATSDSRVLRTRCAGGATPQADYWGVDSEYGVLTDVLLGSAECFRWMGDDNLEFSSICRESYRKGVRFDLATAVRQHAELVDAYRSADVRVYYLEPSEHTPYQVYTRDSNFMTPFGAVVCQLANPRRRGEYAPVLRFYVSKSIPIYELVSAGNFEGGDFNIIEPGAVLIGFSDHRSEEVAAKQVGGWMQQEGWEVKYAPIDEFYVHIDLMVCMLAEKCAAVCLDTTPDDVLTWLKGRKVEIVPVSFRETMALSCNVVALGNDRVVSNAAAIELNDKLRALGFEVYDPDISMFTDAGGGVHCMAQPLRRESG